MGRSRMRVVIRTEEWEAVAFNLPVAEFHTARSLERNSQIPKLGPDILSDKFTSTSGVERLKATHAKTQTQRSQWHYRISASGRPGKRL